MAKNIKYTSTNIYFPAVIVKDVCSEMLFLEKQIKHRLFQAFFGQI
jgi:hypothetical protein